VRLAEAVRLALQHIRAQNLKSVFSAVGVFIGVAFLIGAWSIVNGMNVYMTEKFAGTLIGVNTFHLRRRPNFTPNVSDSTWRAWRRRPRISFEDADAVSNGITIPVITAWWSEDRGDVEYGSKKAKQVSLQGATERYFDIRNIRIEQGRAFTPQEARGGATVLVMGHDLADKLFEGRDPLGKSVRIHGIPYRVIGVAERRGNLLGISAEGGGGRPPGGGGPQAAGRRPPGPPAAVPRRVGPARRDRGGARRGRGDGALGGAQCSAPAPRLGVAGLDRARRAAGRRRRDRRRSVSREPRRPARSHRRPAPRVARDPAARRRRHRARFAARQQGPRRAHDPGRRDRRDGRDGDRRADQRLQQGRERHAGAVGSEDLLGGAALPGRGQYLRRHGRELPLAPQSRDEGRGRPPHPAGVERGVRRGRRERGRGQQRRLRGPQDLVRRLERPH